ncbi:hypothetical protein KM043_010319 [Ampulex compressa]|nr:hypothetical protein KM043_010319 [Ampulex compressa]
MKRSPDGGTTIRESTQELVGVEAAIVEEPPSPEGRLQPEDLSVTTKIKEAKEIRDTSESLPPLKTPELKLSVRKLLGCSPSPPPISRDRTPSPDNCIEVKSRTQNDLKSTSNDVKLAQAPRTLMQNPEEAGKGKKCLYKSARTWITDKSSSSLPVNHRIQCSVRYLVQI